MARACARACARAGGRSCVRAIVRALVHACARACARACVRSCVHSCARACVRTRASLQLSASLCGCAGVGARGHALTRRQGPERRWQLRSHAIGARGSGRSGRGSSVHCCCCSCHEQRIHHMCAGSFLGGAWRWRARLPLRTERLRACRARCTLHAACCAAPRCMVHVTPLHAARCTVHVTPLHAARCTVHVTPLHAAWCMVRAVRCPLRVVRCSGARGTQCSAGERSVRSARERDHAVGPVPGAKPTRLRVLTRSLPSGRKLPLGSFGSETSGARCPRGATGRQRGRPGFNG
jgi:hypothetical protein